MKISYNYVGGADAHMTRRYSLGQVATHWDKSLPT